jgi:hypothetical protein
VELLRPAATIKSTPSLVLEHLPLAKYLVTLIITRFNISLSRVAVEQRLLGLAMVGLAVVVLVAISTARLQQQSLHIRSLSVLVAQAFTT